MRSRYLYSVVTCVVIDHCTLRINAVMNNDFEPHIFLGLFSHGQISHKQHNLDKLTISDRQNSLNFYSETLAKYWCKTFTSSQHLFLFCLCVKCRYKSLVEDLRTYRTTNDRTFDLCCMLLGTTAHVVGRPVEKRPLCYPIPRTSWYFKKWLCFGPDNIVKYTID